MDLNYPGRLAFVNNAAPMSDTVPSRTQPDRNLDEQFFQPKDPSEGHVLLNRAALFNDNNGQPHAGHPSHGSGLKEAPPLSNEMVRCISQEGAYLTCYL